MYQELKEWALGLLLGSIFIMLGVALLVALPLYILWEVGELFIKF